MTYAETIQFLYDLRLFGLKLGLDNVVRLAALAGRPQDRLRFVHVAGTNGKGSTCAMLEGIYRSAGLKVGLFTSPHLVSFRERIQVDRRLIAEDAVVRLVDELRAGLRDFPADHHPTFFEVVTVLALRHFAEQQCDLVVWETGMGGRLDATNIVAPLASLITNIQFDHQKWLGSTRTEIAAEKAGIIKPGVPVLTTTDDPDALAVIERTARERKAPLMVLDPERVKREWPADRPLALLGEHQKVNAALALAAVEVLATQIPVSAAAGRQGLGSVRWPGRLQKVELPGGRVALLDGAHNPAGAETLRAALAQYYPGERPALILGILQDKDWAAMCETLAPLASRLLLVPVKSERSAPPEALQATCQKAAPGVPLTVCHSLGEALAGSENDAFRLVAGSLYLVGEALEFLHVSPANGREERDLNEWSPGGATTKSL